MPESKHYILETAVSDRHGEGVMYFPTEEYIDMTEGDELTEWTRGAGGPQTSATNLIMHSRGTTTTRA